MNAFHQEVIRQAFTQQAENFENAEMSFSKKEYLEDMLQKIGPRKTDMVLEAAAGTCACGRAIAPLVQSVVCLDMTPAMLLAGKTKAETAGLDNMTFVLGDAEKLPFLDSSFTMVLSRLAFHHFLHVEQVFSEMVRVLKPKGRLVLIDMETEEGTLRETKDRIEKMRDASHVRNLTRSEMRALYEKNGLRVQRGEACGVPVRLQSWLELTKTPKNIQKEICKLMQEELQGGKKTGFEPYRKGKEVYFEQKWILLTGEKK